MSRLMQGMRFCHYKGGLYTVEALAIDEASGEAMVIYVNDHGDTFVRKASSFFDVEHGEPRFKPYLTPRPAPPPAPRVTELCDE